MTVVEVEEEPASTESLEVAMNLAGLFEPGRHGRKTRCICATVECLGCGYVAEVNDIRIDSSGTHLVAKGDRTRGDGAFAWKGAISDMRTSITDRGTLLYAPGQPLLMLNGVGFNA